MRPSRPIRDPARRGFTLLEMMITVAIAAVFAAMTIGGYEYMKPRVSAANLVHELASYVFRSRARARAEEINVVVGVISWSGGAAIGYLDDRKNTCQTSADLVSLLQNGYCKSGFPLVPSEQERAAPNPIVQSGAPWAVFPFPFKAVPVANTAAMVPSGCTFCVTNMNWQGAPAVGGAMMFTPSGRMVLSSAGATGGAVIFQPPGSSAEALLVASSGAAEVVSQ